MKNLKRAVCLFKRYRLSNCAEVHLDVNNTIARNCIFSSIIGHYILKFSNDGAAAYKNHQNFEEKECKAFAWKTASARGKVVCLAEIVANETSLRIPTEFLNMEIRRAHVDPTTIYRVRGTSRPRPFREWRGSFVDTPRAHSPNL